MAGYTIKKTTTIQNLRDAKKIYEKLNNADPKPNPQQKAQNDAAIAHAENAEKYISAVRKKYAQVYPDIPYLSSSETLLSLQGIEDALKTKKGAGFDLQAQGDMEIVNQVIGIEKQGWKATARGYGSAFFHDKDGKFSTCKLEVAGVGVAAAGLVANKTVGGFLLNKALPWIGKAIAAIWGFSPLTTIGLGIFAATKLFSLGKKLLAPVFAKVQQHKEYVAAMNKANDEAAKVDTTVMEEHKDAEAAFRDRLTEIGSQLKSADPAVKTAAQKDLFRVLMEIRDAGPDVLNETEKNNLIGFVKTQDEFAGITKTGDGMEERFDQSKGARSRTFNAKVEAVKNAIKTLDVNDPAKVNAVKSAIQSFETFTIRGSGPEHDQAEQLRTILIAQFNAELEYAMAKKLDSSKIQAVHNATAKELNVETQMNI